MFTNSSVKLPPYGLNNSSTVFSYFKNLGGGSGGPGEGHGGGGPL